LEVALDPRAVAAAGGVAFAYLARKYAYQNFRNVFGVAAKGDDGKVHYYGLDEKGAVDTSQEIKGAFGNRLLVNAATATLGLLVIGRVRDANVDYLALGVTADAMANFVLNLLNLE
jgi:hypothetical protein